MIRHFKVSIYFFLIHKTYTSNPSQPMPFWFPSIIPPFGKETKAKKSIVPPMSVPTKIRPQHKGLSLPEAPHITLSMFHSIAQPSPSSFTHLLENHYQSLLGLHFPQHFKRSPSAASTFWALTKWVFCHTINAIFTIFMPYHSKCYNNLTAPSRVRNMSISTINIRFEQKNVRVYSYILRPSLDLQL